MNQTVLWLDNDPSHLKPYLRALTDLSLNVSVASTLLEAEKFLQERPPAILILDVMIPTKNEEEERLYPPHETDLGYKTGLIFFKRHREFLEKHSVKVLVMTVRLDEDILKEFLAAGLPPQRFTTKFKVRDISTFRNLIRQLLT